MRTNFHTFKWLTQSEQDLDTESTDEAMKRTSTANRLKCRAYLEDANMCDRTLIDKRSAMQDVV